MRARLEFFFDCSSPWTYLAFVRLLERADRIPADLVWRPVLVGGVFNKVNADVYKQREMPNKIKQKYYQKDLRDWANYCGIKIVTPSVFPVRSVTAMRGCFYALEKDRIIPYVSAVFQAYWGNDRDISLDEVIVDCAESAGLDGKALIETAQSPQAKAALIKNTDELIERGGFGSPTFFLNTHDIYFGNDRLELVEAAANRFKNLGHI